MGRIIPMAVLALASQGCVIENLVDDPDSQVDGSLLVEERFFQVALPRVDVLWVIDNTGSMAEEQARLAAAFQVFVEGLSTLGIDYQLGVVTTDMNGQEGGVLQGNPWIVTSLLDDPVQAFVAAAEVGTDGIGPEAGLAAMVAALKEPTRSTENRGFRREDASLHVVVLSDADDHSEAWLGVDPARVALALLEDERQRTGRLAKLSAVVGDLPLGCFSSTGRAMAGDRYIDVANQTGGSHASICEDDFSDLLQNLGSVGVEYPVRFELQAEPAADSVRVSLDGQSVLEGWSLESEPPTIVFDEPPVADTRIDVQYRLKDEDSE